MTDPSTLKTTIKRNMELLQQAGLDVSAFDVQTAFVRARERKVQELLGGLFNSLSLEELGIAAGVVSDMMPPLAPAAFIPASTTWQSSTAATATSPPAPSPRAAKSAKRK